MWTAGISRSPLPRPNFCSDLTSAQGQLLLRANFCSEPDYYLVDATALELRLVRHSSNTRARRRNELTEWIHTDGVANILLDVLTARPKIGGQSAARQTCHSNCSSASDAKFEHATHENNQPRR